MLHKVLLCPLPELTPGFAYCLAHSHVPSPEGPSLPLQEQTGDVALLLGPASGIRREMTIRNGLK